MKIWETFLKKRFEGEGDGTWWEELGLIGTDWEGLGLTGIEWDWVGGAGTDWD